MRIDESVTGRIIPNCAFGAGSESATAHNGLPGGNSGREPPDPIPNSEVKTSSADGSVGLSHARVGHRQAFNSKTPGRKAGGFLFSDELKATLTAASYRYPFSSRDRTG